MPEQRSALTQGVSRVTGQQLREMVIAVDVWAEATDKDRWDAAAMMINLAHAAPAVDTEGGHVIMKVTERSVYNALKNLIIGKFGLTKETVMAEILRLVNPQDVVRNWMNGQNVREFVGKTAREVVKELATAIIKEEVKAAINGRVKISIGE